MDFSQSSSEQLEQIVALLQESFQVQSDDPSVNRAYLYWKYYAEGPLWPGSRSYILSNGSTVLAHAAIWPVRIRLAGEVREGIGFGDWASSPEHRGAGLLLLKKLTALTSFVLVTGGRDITRSILLRSGFKRWANRPMYTRILRPIRQALTQENRLGWKESLRVARNTYWSLSRSAPARDWIAEKSEPNAETLALVEQQTGSLHTVEFLQYLLRCPTVAFQFMTLRQGNVPRGYCVVGLVGNLARIAEIRIASEDQTDWASAVAAVVGLLRSHPQACTVSAMGSVPKLDQALLANGFHIREQVPTVIFDKEGQMAEATLPQLGMLEDDASVL